MILLSILFLLLVLLRIPQVRDVVSNTTGVDSQTVDDWSFYALLIIGGYMLVKFGALFSIAWIAAPLVIAGILLLGIAGWSIYQKFSSKD
tara:strand:+ start:4780 stop:5049 length:270 start_codon:yes stop_codon:yes gene_type:complete